jgi:DNA modification methylase
MSSYKLIHGDFRTVNIEDNSIDAIITDPPYLEEYLHHYEDLALFAKRVLKPGGNFLVLIGHYHMPKILEIMTRYMTYQWVFCLKHSGHHSRLWNKKIFVMWKPILWFTNGKCTQDWWVSDMFISDGREKQYHIWQQNASAFYELIEKFTNQGDTVLDPFMGSGTTGIAALQQERNFIGIDIDHTYIEITERRVHEMVQKMQAFYPDFNAEKEQLCNLQHIS